MTDKVAITDQPIYEVVLVGPVRVDVGQFSNNAPLACPPPSARLDSTKVVPGGTDRLTVGGFSPHAAVRVTLNSKAFKLESTLGMIKTDGVGGGHLVFTVPAGTPLGTHWVYATSSRPSNFVGIQFEVIAAPAHPSPPSLAETGSHTAGLTALGFALILSGGALLVLTRRRRTAAG